MTSPRKPAKRRTSETDPLSWLYINPTQPSAEGLSFGVLRKTYAGRTNSAEEFGRRKLQPIEPKGSAAGAPWRITAERAEVILPAEADALLADPETLLRQADACTVDREPALLTYLTLPFQPDDRLHAGWERCRSFAREALVRDRQLAVLTILHAPGRAGSERAPHCHLLIVPRRIGRLGLAQAPYDEALIHDGGQALIETLWLAHRDSWR